MASMADQPSTATQTQTTPPQTAPVSRVENAQENLSSTPLEMNTLPPSATAAAATSAPANTTIAQMPATTHAETSTPASANALPPVNTQNAPAESIAKPAPPTDLTRSETEAIGPSTDTPAANPDNTNGPVLVIMLLLTTGARHPYKIDERYLKKRNVQIEDNDPYNISVYTLKELIWRDWREEWEPRPTSHSSIRLIHFGRMLDDKSPLKECRFQTDTPNVVHMTVKPQDVVDEEDAKIGKGNSRRDGDEEPTAGCRCVIL